jgi:hypothetical protein
LKNFYRSPFSKWTPQYRTNSTLSDFNEILYLGRFMMSRTDSSEINSGHHYLPTYQILMISDNVEFLLPIFYAVFWQPKNFGVFRVKNHDFTTKNLIFFNCGERREYFWGISCEKSRFYAKKTYFFHIVQLPYGQNHVLQAPPHIAS